MGMIVECNDQEIWSPSLRVGALFLEEIRAVERLVDQKSGVETPLADMLEIDAATFDAFVDRVLQAMEATNNGPLFAMVAGCLKVAIALRARITGRWPEVSPRLQPLVADARTVMHALST
jgi:hypothetical protein